ncbi:hypothetical protein HPB51_017268 [Rhipicephalus microplus]|uniref:Nlr family card domain protein n=1 Tax=Rhipicephalus microplus TaxID=6941 RepID=A0A9J6EUJ2_RHIMP|nr:hypothetical protein HPB51_017268 [Rhipicephalus microplus]
MDLAESVFIKSHRIDLIPCTSREGHLCHIFGDISLMNQGLWWFNIELRELEPGRLSLVHSDEAYGGVCTRDSFVRKEVQEVVKLLGHLLTFHQCVSSVVITRLIFDYCPQLICDALRKNASLTELKLYALDTTTSLERSITAALLNLKHLQKLEVKHFVLQRPFIDGLSEFLASTQSLTTFDVAHQFWDSEDDAVAFVQALRRNQSITTLSLDVTLIGTQEPYWRPGMLISHKYVILLADYLYGNKTLRTLTLRGSFGGRFTDVARPVVMGLVKNNTITNLSLFLLPLEDEDIELITWLLSENQTLKSFKMFRCDLPVSSSRFYSNLLTLLGNKTFERLTLDLPWSGKSDRWSLFRTLGSNPSFKKVTFERWRDSAVSRLLRDNGVQKSFFIGTHCVLQNTEDALTECKDLSSVIVMSESFDRFEQLLTTLSQLPSCSHVTSLCLALLPAHFRGTAGCLISECITGMIALRNLELSIDGTGVGDAFIKARREVAQALSENKTICTLRLYGSWFGRTETEMLADTVQSSRTLCELYLFPCHHIDIITLMQKLVLNISSNYSLLVMRLRAQCAGNDVRFTVSDVIRRNCTLVMRAAHFVCGERLKYCAEAAEMVHWTPGLVDRVQKLASVDENEAVCRIKTSLKSFCELNDFMRLAGVVKYGVTCHSRDDGQKQLVDIGRDCWLCIREYLKVSDILDER